MAQAASGRAGRLRERGSSGRDAGAAWRRWRHRGSCVMLRNAAIPFVPEAAHLELVIIGRATLAKHAARDRSEEHKSELQSLMRISYAVFCLKQQNTHNAIAHSSNETT